MSEAPSHLWGLWATAEHLFSTGPFRRTAALNFPGAFTGDLIDPVSLVVFWPVWALAGRGATAAVLAWNALHLATVLLAGWGGYRLSRRLVPDPLAAVVGAAVCAASPYLMASTALGRSEYLAGAWYPLHLAFLHAHLSADRRPRDTVGAILTLAGLAWSGWTLALWVALLEIPVALVFSRALPDAKTRILRLIQVGLPAVLLALPFLWSVLVLDPWWLKRLAPGQAMPVVLVMPLQNLLRYSQGWPVGGGLEVAPYPGTVAPLLMAWGLWKRPGEAWPWVAFAVVLVVLALGPEIQIAGPTGPVWRGYAPVAWLQSLVPGMGAIQNWPRIAALLAAPLGVAAAWGVASVGRRRPSWQPVAVIVLGFAIVADQGTWTPPSKAPSFQVSLPVDIQTAMDALPEGPILELPIDNDQQPTFGVWEDYSLLWQLQHRHPSSEVPSPQISAAYQSSAFAYDLASGNSVSTDSCMGSEATRLYNAGFRGVVLQKRRLPVETARSLESALRGMLGDPAFTTETVASWAVKAQGEVPDSCAAPLKRTPLRR